MNKITFSFTSLLIAAAAVFTSISCDKEVPTEVKTPEFPELVTVNDIEPGTELTLTFTPNMVWSLSIPAENYKWFKIKDGKFEVQTLSGVSSAEPITITIVTDSEESFFVRSTDVVLKMGGKEQVIAKYTLKAKEKAVQVYAASINENGNYIFTENHQHVYDADEMTQLELRWDENDGMFYFPIKVISNFEWTIEWPSWARADIVSETRVGEVCFDVYGISSKLPYEAATGEIKFLSDGQVIKTYPIAIPACKDKFKFNLSGNLSLTYDHAGYMHTESGVYTKEPVPGFIFGPKESRIVFLEKNTEGKYVQTDSPWLNITVDNWDSVEGADVLQTRQFKVSAPKYLEQNDREAIVLFLPATAPTDLNEIVTPDGVADAYKSYAIPVSQTGRPEEYFTFEASQDERELVGVLFAKSETPLLPEKNFDFAEGCDEYQYNLSYVKDMASSKSALFVSEPFEEVKIYDSAGNEIKTDLSDHWLRFNLLGTGLYGQVVMDMTTFTGEEGAPDEIDGYIVFLNDEGKALSIVHCFYKKEVVAEEDVLEDVGAEFFVDPTAAAAAGATMHKVISGPTYDAHKESLAPIYILKYTKNNTQLDLKTSSNLFIYMCQGKPNGPEMVMIDGQTYGEPDLTMGYLLEWDDSTNQYIRPYKGTTTIKMTMPADADSTSMTEVIQFNSSMDSNSRVMNVICVLDLSGSSN